MNDNFSEMENNLGNRIQQTNFNSTKVVYNFGNLREICENDQNNSIQIDVNSNNNNYNGGINKIDKAPSASSSSSPLS